MSTSGGGGESDVSHDYASFDTSGQLTDITGDKSFLIDLTTQKNREDSTHSDSKSNNRSMKQEDSLFGDINAKLKSTPIKNNDTIIDIGEGSISLINKEKSGGSTISEDYGKRKRDDTDESLLVNTGPGTTDESINSTEQSDPDSSVKDESDFSADGAEEHANSTPKADLRNKFDDDFPNTVSVLKTNNGAKVYLVGTAHFSEESQDDVSRVIQKVRPHIVMVELCSQRVNILQLDEKTILEEAKNINFEKIRGIVEQNGLLNGLMYILLLNMSAKITKQLGIAPGGEFRRALQEAKNIPQCIIHLGDRPIQVTMHRALSALSWWQTIKLVWRLITSDDPISKEDVERCKQRGLIREMLADMEGEFPALKKVFVQERDIFLTHSLQIAASTKTNSGPIRVVGVVGIGHVQGILDNWGTVNSKAIPPIMKIPPTSMSSRILKVSVKFAMVGLIVYAGYKVVPKRWIPI